MEASEVRNADRAGNRFDASVNRSMMEVLERAEYRLVAGGDDLEDICRLRYKSYLRSGMCGPIPEERFEDRWDDLPNSFRFGIYYDGKLVSTLRIHHLSAEHPNSPSVDAYPEVVLPRLAAGETFIDGTRFATDPDSEPPAPWVLPLLTLRLGMVASCYFGQNAVLTPVRIEHSAFYHRLFNAIQRTEGKLFPGVLAPIALFEIPSGENLHVTLKRFPFLRSLPQEQQLTFGNAAVDPLVPVRIFPTAKQAREAA